MLITLGSVSLSRYLYRHSKLKVTAVALINKNSLVVSLHEKVRNTHPITTKLGRSIPRHPSDFHYVGPVGLYMCINSLWASDSIWWHRSGSPLVQVMACCLKTPSHYLKQCWLFISHMICEVSWHLPEGNFTGTAQDISLWYEFEMTNLSLQPCLPGSWFTKDTWAKKCHKSVQHGFPNFSSCNDWD